MKNPPTAGELDGVLEKLKMQPRDLIRKKEKNDKAAGLDDK